MLENLKVLLVAPVSQPEHEGKYIKEAMERQGVNLSVFDYRQVSRYAGIERMNSNLLDLAKKINPEYVLILKGEELKPETIKGMKDVGMKTIIWFFDLEKIPEVVRNAQLVDYFFLHTEQNRKYYTDLGVNFNVLEEATDLHAMPLLPYDRNYASDIAFIGSFKPGRENWLKAVESHCKDRDLSLKIYGNGWSRSDLTKYWSGCPVYNREFAKVCSSSKIVLCLGYYPYFWMDLSARVYMAAGCKGFVLHPEVSHLEKMYKPNDEIITYKHVEDLILNIDLFTDEKRKEIVEKAYDRTVKEHTYDKRIEKLFKNIENGSFTK